MEQQVNIQTEEICIDSYDETSSRWHLILFKRFSVIQTISEWPGKLLVINTEGVRSQLEPRAKLKTSVKFLYLIDMF